MTGKSYHFERALQANVGAVADDLSAPPILPSARHDLSRKLAPAASLLLDLIEDDTLPDRVTEPLGTALLILADVAEDDDLGLTGATPEAYAAARPESFVRASLPVPDFDAALFTPYVRAIYVREIEAVRLAPADCCKTQLTQSARTLARIVAASALPLEHVRESLLLAARSLPLSQANHLIEDAFQIGLRSPRSLPATRRGPK